MSNNIIEIPKILCEECKIREATRLCDYDIGYNIDLEDRGKVKRVTCDKKLCEKCSHKLNRRDYCKEHWKEIKKEVKEYE